MDKVMQQVEPVIKKVDDIFISPDPTCSSRPFGDKRWKSTESALTLYLDMEHLGRLTGQLDYVERWKDMLCSVARPENAAQSERDGFDLRVVHSIVDRFITRKDYLHPERFDYDSLADLLASDSQYGNTLPGRAPRQPDRESQERERRERRERDRDQEQHRERIEKRSRVNTLKALLENCDLPTDSHDAADLDAYANTLEVRLEQHLAAARDQQNQQQPLLAPGYGISNKQYKALSSMSLIVS